MRDSALTDRKIIVNTYDVIARHGSGAFSGKIPPSKVYRFVAYAGTIRSKEYCCRRTC